MSTRLTHIGQILAEGHRAGIPLDARVKEVRGWLRAQLRVEIPDELAPVFGLCESGAEARFLWEFCTRPGVHRASDLALTDGVLIVSPQVPWGGYRIDFLVSFGQRVLALEVDGMGFHRMTAEQVAADYVRERKIVARLCPLMRFTAQEAFHETAACWLDIAAFFHATPLKKSGGSSEKHPGFSATPLEKMGGSPEKDPVFQKRGA